MDSALPKIRRRSLVILISDCLDSLPKLESMVQKYRHAKHEVIVFRIAAPEEVDFPFERPTQFHDLEKADHRLLVDPVRLRSEYLRQYSEFSKGLEQIASNSEIDYRCLQTTDPVQEVMGDWLAERMNTK